MLFFVVTCFVLLIGIPLVNYGLKNLRQNQGGADSSTFSDDSAFYTASASERYGAAPDSTNSDSSDSGACSNLGQALDSSSDITTCDSDDDGGGDSGSSSD
jgi:hypothetical protein